MNSTQKHTTISTLIFVAFAILLATVITLGCMYATVKNYTSIGSSAVVKLYSGGVLVEQWKSTGKVLSENSSDGWRFVCEETDKLIRVTGTVVVEN